MKDWYPNDKITTVSCLRCNKIIEQYPNPMYQENILNKSNSFSFSYEKDKVINKINFLIEEYEKFTKTVSSKNRRITGHHFTKLKKMKEDIVNLSEPIGNENENE